MNVKTKLAALNAKLKKDGVIKCQNENTALNTKLKRGGDSKCQMKNDMMTLNAELEPWLWTPNYEEMVALNAKLKAIAMNAKREQRLWMLN